LSWAGYVGVYPFCNRQWTLVLKNGSSHNLTPLGTSESSGALHTTLKLVRPGQTDEFTWKKATGAWYGAVGAIHFTIGDTGKVLSLFGCIPMDMNWNKAKCNLHVGSRAMSAENMEEGTGGCNEPVAGGQVGNTFDSTFTMTNAASAEFRVDFNCKCSACST